MDTASTPSPAHHHPYRTFDLRVGRFLGADMRLLYGMAVPVLGVSVAIAFLLGLTPSPVVVGGLIVLLLACVVVVLAGFLGMLNESEQEDEEERLSSL